MPHEPPDSIPDSDMIKNNNLNDNLDDGDNHKILIQKNAVLKQNINHTSQNWKFLDR